VQQGCATAKGIWQDYEGCRCVLSCKARCV